jgi:hypothetical protein
MRHLIDGFPEFTGKKFPKGVEIRAGSGIKDLNPQSEKGVEIKKHYRG